MPDRFGGGGGASARAFACPRTRDSAARPHSIPIPLLTANLLDGLLRLSRAETPQRAPLRQQPRRPGKPEVYRPTADLCPEIWGDANRKSDGSSRVFWEVLKCHLSSARG